MAKLDDLHDALTAGDWPKALSLALDLWRASKDPALADLIDRITANCTLPVPGQELPAEQQLWWVQRAQVATDPVVVAGLLARLGQRTDYLDAAIDTVRRRWSTGPRTPLSIHLGSSNRWPTNFQERAALLLQWPADPRVAMAIVDLLRSKDAPHAHGIPELYDALADLVGEIGDVRTRDKLAAMAAEPRGGQETIRKLQVAFGTRALANFAKRPPQPLDLAACLAVLPPPPAQPSPPARLQIEALWKEVAANPDDVGTRAVLGDALVEAGDLRGDVIVLQCNARVPHRPLRGGNRGAYDGRVKTLLRKQWNEWFGDLGLILARRACEFHCGMLEVAMVGQATSPDWAYKKSQGHRELACVHTVRPGWVTTDNFATFILGLPRFPRRLALTGIDVIETLADRGASFDRLYSIELVRSPVTGPNDKPLPDWTSKPFREALAKLAITVPHVSEISVKSHLIARLFQPLRREVRMMFPKLQRLTVDEATAMYARDLIDDNTFTIA